MQIGDIGPANLKAFHIIRKYFIYFCIEYIRLELRFLDWDPPLPKGTYANSKGIGNKFKNLIKV